jgi:hypothetical protein
MVVGVATDLTSAELSFRLAAWRELLDQGGPSNVDRALIRDLKMYGGAQGVWVDTVRTRPIGGGVAVGLLHTGRHYADDLSPTGILYHYPRTQRPPGRDAAEIAAAKRAGELAFPVFVITPSAINRNRRDVHLGWISDWDDEDEIFLVTFTDDAVLPTPADGSAPPSTEPFTLFSEDTQIRRVLVAARPNQQRFKFDVIARYGAACAVCGINAREVLDAVHITEKRQQGSDHAENGLILCATHHRAFDAGLFCINPDTLEIHVSDKAIELRLTQASLKHLKASPHPDALRWRWNRWPGRTTTAVAPV